MTTQVKLYDTIYKYCFLLNSDTDIQQGFSDVYATHIHFFFAILKLYYNFSGAYFQRYKTLHSLHIGPIMFTKFHIRIFTQ